jgi:uncharacterized repeat protein (TIGR01451 family)
MVPVALAAPLTCVMILVTGVVAAPTAVAAPGSPFACLTPTIFVAQGDPTQLDALTYGTGSTSFVPIGQPGRHYNGIAFNLLDGFIYASSQAPGSIGDVLQVDSTGALSSTGITVPESRNVGVFDLSGNYFTMNSSATTLYKVNIAARTIMPIALSRAPAAPDLSFVGGVLWGKAANGELVRVDPTTGVVTGFQQTAVPPGDDAGAAWTFANGNLGLSYNSAGTVYQVKIANPTGPSPTFTLISSATGPASGSNDGTSCPGQPVDLGIAKTASVGTGARITWTLTVHNYGPGISSGYTVSDTVPASVTDVATATAGCSITANTLSCVGGVLQPGADATITLTGTAPSTYGTKIANTALVIGNDEDPNPRNDSSTSATGNSSSTVPSSARILPLTCTGHRIVLLDVHRVGNRVEVSGLARTSYRGTPASIQPLNAGRRGRSVKAMVRQDGSFRATLPLPPRHERATVRYQATIAGKRSSALKLMRQLTIVGRHATPAGTRITARLSRPTRRHAVTIRRQLSCTTYRRLATVRTDHAGRFTIILPAPSAPDPIAYYRATIRRGHGRTYTLPVAVRAAASP